MWKIAKIENAAKNYWDWSSLLGLKIYWRQINWDAQVQSLDKEFLLSHALLIIAC